MGALFVVLVIGLIKVVGASFIWFKIYLCGFILKWFAYAHITSCCAHRALTNHTPATTYHCMMQEALLALEGGLDIVDPSLAEWLSQVLPVDS